MSLSSEEKMMTGFIKFEQFFKRYKYIIIAAVVAVIVAIGAYFVQSYMHQSSLKKANEAFITLQKDPQNTQALATLQQHNQKLYQLFKINQEINNKNLNALLEYDSTQEIRDIASYHTKLKTDSLGEYEGLYRDLANLIEGYHLLKERKFKQARAKLQAIDENSMLSQNAQTLLHYSVGK